MIGTGGGGGGGSASPGRERVDEDDLSMWAWKDLSFPMKPNILVLYFFLPESTDAGLMFA